MDTEKYLKEIQKFYSDNSDVERQKKYAYYFKEGFDSYGVEQDIFMTKKDEWYEAWFKKEPIDAIISFGNVLVESGKYEEGSLAIMFLIKHKKQFTSENFIPITNWLDFGLRNWAHIDFFSSKVIGVFLEKKIVKYESMASWRKAGSKWKRRATPVSMLSLLKMEHDIGTLLSFIECMMDDKERVVHQGLGWFLREAWKKHPKEVEQFLHKYKNTSARLIFKYATEKMSKEYRLQFRKEK